MSFFPKADAALLPPSPGERMHPLRLPTVSQIYDRDGLDRPIGPWAAEMESCLYPQKPEPYSPSPIPKEPTSPTERYTRAHLAKNERLRLSTLWYHGQDIDQESELLLGLQEKVCLAQESTGWEFSVIGLLDINVYIRLATVGVPRAILPRGETICAHTVTQPPGSVFLLPNMLEDWRFRESPYVEQGGLTAYAGVPLRLLHESGECVSLGSLCVASSTSQPPLSRQQQQALARLGDWVVADIVQCTRARRQRERRRLAELIATAEDAFGDDDTHESVLKVMRTAYPNEVTSIQSPEANQHERDGQSLGLPSGLKNGLWEDTAYIDDVIAASNHTATPTDRVVRLFSAQCESKLGPSLLVVATKDFRRIFDDVDAWFIQSCATLLNQIWQRRVTSEAIRVKERFLRGISHQLRTPIHGILGAAELLAEDLNTMTVSEDASARSMLAAMANYKDIAGRASLYLDTISCAGRELMSTVNNMITLNRWADVAVADRRNTTFDIDDLETELLQRVSKSAVSRTASMPSIFFHSDLPQDNATLQTDISLLCDSILPLIMNAIQNTPAGVVAIQFSMLRGTRTLVIDVKDTGCGIRPEDRQRIFQLYEKVGKHSTGAGLGLTLAAKFAALLHGTIELVSSQIKSGSHFRATFKDATHASSAGSLHDVASSLGHLPPKFHHLATDPPPAHLSCNFAELLTRRGFAPSNSSAKDCFTIFQYSHDSENFASHISLLPSEQVAICLVPNSVDTESIKELPNVHYVRGPFTTSKLSSTLRIADELAMELQNLHKGLAKTEIGCQSNGNTVGHCTPPKAACPSPDDGYISMGSLSSDSEALSPTLDTGSESSSDGGLSPFSPVGESATITRPLTPARPVRSSKPLALVVDDNLVNLRILEMYCKTRGLPFVSATNGNEAVDVFSKHQSLGASGGGAPVELVLMDMQMPECDGIDATRQIRVLEQQHSSTSSVIFIVTGQDGQLDREAASDAGADDYMVKPIGLRRLDADLKRYFSNFKG